MTSDRWIALVGLAIGIISVAMAVYFYRRTDKKRIPTFVVGPARKTLVQPELTKFGKFTLLHDGTETGKNGITAIQVYFWNSGSLEILSSQVLKPYSISISAGRILDWSVKRTNRDVIRPQIVRVGDTLDALRLSFAVLEPGDGAVIEIVYDGPPNAKVEIDGVCVGSQRPTVLPSDPVYFSTGPRQLFNIFLQPLALFLAAMAGASFAVGVLWTLAKVFGDRAAEIVFLGFFGAVAAGVVGSIVWRQYIRAVNRYVPPGIKPD